MRLEELLKTAPNYGWGGLGIEIISMYPESPVAIISEPLAGCDDEFVSVLNWVPLEWQNECAVFDHPYIKANAPEVYRDRERWTYRMALSFFWGWRAGTLGISERMASQWWESLGRLPIKWRWLVPGIMAPLMILSLKIWPKRLPKLITDTKRWAMGPRKS